MQVIGVYLARPNETEFHYIPFGRYRKARFLRHAARVAKKDRTIEQVKRIPVPWPEIVFVLKR